MTMFHERLRRLRLERGWGITELAREAGLRKTQISYYEIGRYRPTGDALIRLADALEVTLDYLMRGEESPYPRRGPERVTALLGGRIA